MTHHTTEDLKDQLQRHGRTLTSATATPTPASSPTPSVYEGLPDFVPSELDPAPAAAEGYVRDAR